MIGGQGRQRLTDLSPDPEGYTGAQIKIATGAGKITIYIVPLQEELDLSPLQDDAKEFEKIPKAACKSCSREMPLQVLALHVEDCIPPEDEEVSNKVGMVSKNLHGTLKKKKKFSILNI